MIILVDEELEALRNLSRDELIGFVNEYIALGAPNRRKFVLRSLGSDGARTLIDHMHSCAFVFVSPHHLLLTLSFNRQGQLMRHIGY